MKYASFLLGLLLSATFFCGCAGYQRGSAVPSELRTIHVPAFENKTEFPMAGAMVSQQFLDLLIEDGVFTPAPFETARLRMQAVIEKCSTDSVRYDRNNVIIPSEYYLTLTAKVYIYDAQTGETFVKGKSISAVDTMLTRNHYQTGVTDVLPRLSRKLARNILDQLHSIERKPESEEDEEAMADQEAIVLGEGEEVDHEAGLLGDEEADQEAIILDPDEDADSEAIILDSDEDTDSQEEDDTNDEE